MANQVNGPINPTDYENEAAMSIDPSLQTGQAQTAAMTEPQPVAACTTTPLDGYTDSGNQPEILTLDTPVCLTHPERFAGNPSRTLGELLVQAGSSRRTEAQAAQEELASVISHQMANPTDSGQEMCYADQDQDLANALALLMSRNPAKRREGAQVLEIYILNNEADLDLRRGLLVSLSKIGNRESLQALAEIYQRSASQPEIRQAILSLPNSHEVLQGVARNNAELRMAQSNAAPHSLGGAGEIGKAFSAGSAGSPGSLGLGNAGADLLATVTQTVSDHIRRIPDLPTIFDADGIDKIAERLIQISQDPNLTNDQLLSHLRLAVLGTAWNQPTLSGGNFAPLAGLASDIARSVYGELANGENPSATARAVGQATAEERNPVVLGTAEGISNVREGSSPLQTVRGFLSSLLQFAIHEGPNPMVAAMTPPLSTTANAGLQGALSTLATGPGNFGSTYALGVESHPSYYIEGNASIDGEGNQDLGGDSQHSSGNSDQDDQHPQDQPQPDSYLA